MTLESDIQTQIIEYLRGRPATYVLNVGGGASTAKGTSDLIVCYRGQFVAFEVKRDEKVYGVTKTQNIRRRQVEKAEGSWFTVVTLHDVVLALDLIDESLKGRTCGY